MAPRPDTPMTMRSTERARATLMIAALALPRVRTACAPDPSELDRGNRRASLSRALDSMLFRSSATAPEVTASSNGHSIACITTSLALASFASRLAYATPLFAAAEKSVAQRIVPKGDRLRRATVAQLRIVKTGQVASRRTFSATDPSTSR